MGHRLGQLAAAIVLVAALTVAAWVVLGAPIDSTRPAVPPAATTDCGTPARPDRQVICDPTPAAPPTAPAPSVTVGR
jgi:hypothetical protein